MRWLAVFPFASAVLLIGLWLGAGGCASGVYGHPALVPGDVPSAELVILRKSELALGAFALLIRLDGEKLVKLRTGRYAEFRVRPGVYRLSMDDPQNLARVDVAALDQLHLGLEARTYILLSKHHISWGISGSAQFCEPEPCAQANQPTRVSGRPIMGFQRISVEEARAMMSEYKRVKSE
jgi:hypothetical protein